MASVGTNLSKFAQLLGTRCSGEFNQLLQNCLPSIDYLQIRFAKSPAQSQKGFKKKHIRYHLLKIPGDQVDEKTILGTQKRINYHPGLNVALNPRDKSLYALCAGTVYYSFERFVPNEKHPVVQQFYNSPTNVPYYRQYVHVVPDKLTNEFRMIDIV